MEVLSHRRRGAAWDAIRPEPHRAPYACPAVGSINIRARSYRFFQEPPEYTNCAGAWDKRHGILRIILSHEFKLIFDNTIAGIPNRLRACSSWKIGEEVSNNYYREKEKWVMEFKQGVLYPILAYRVLGVTDSRSLRPQENRLMSNSSAVTILKSSRWYCLALILSLPYYRPGLVTRTTAKSRRALTQHEVMPS